MLKQLMWGAGRNMAGLYVSEACESIWATFPYLVADQKNPEDCEKDAVDHSADALRYAITAATQRQHKYRQPSPAKLMTLNEQLRYGYEP